MPYLVGALLALGVGAFATLVGFDRERSFYPTVTIVIASYYWLFAIIGGGTALMPEILVATPFIALAVVGTLGLAESAVEMTFPPMLALSSFRPSSLEAFHAQIRSVRRRRRPSGCVSVPDRRGPSARGA
jgi:hypothetical protein